MTYSLIATDGLHIGVAVASRYPGVGAIVPWARAGVGAVATQAAGHRRYGRLGLAGIEAGEVPTALLARLLTEDEDAERRQVGMLDTEGRVAQHTGRCCVSIAGHQIGEGVAVQANMVTGPEVWHAVVEGYDSSSGTLTQRLLAGLQAGEEAGGDVRGRQAAALLVVPAVGDPDEVVTDIRIDEHTDPLARLGELVALQEAFVLVSEADGLAARGEVHVAYRLVARALTLSTDEQIRCYAAALAAADGQLELARLHASELSDPHRWAVTLERLSEAGVAPAGTHWLAEVLEAARAEG